MPSKVTLVFAATLALTTSSIVEAGRPRMYYSQRVERDVDSVIDADLDANDNEKMRRDLFSSIPNDLKPSDSGDSVNVFDPATRQKSPTTNVIVEQTVVVPSGGTGVANLNPNPSPEPQPTTLSLGHVRPEPGATGSGMLVGVTGVDILSSTSVLSESNSTPVKSEVSTPEPTATSQDTVQTSQQMAPTTTGRSILDPIGSIIGDLLLPAPSSANSTMVESETSTPLSSSPSTTELPTSSSSDATSSSATTSSPATISSPATVSLPTITLSPVTTSSPATASSPATTSSPAASDSLAPVTSAVTETSTEVASSTTFETSTRTTETPIGTGLIPILTSVVSSVLPVPTSESAVFTSSAVTKTSTDGTQITTSPTRIIPTTEIASIATQTFSSPTYTSIVPSSTATDVPHGKATTTTGGEATNLTPALTPTLTPGNSANVTETATATTTTPTSTPLPTSTNTGVITLSASSNATKPATTSVGSISTPVGSTPVETTTVATRTETTPLLTPTPISTQTGVMGSATTATGTSTSDWLPTTMILESTGLSITAPTMTKTTTTTTSLHANIPKVIVPFDDGKPAPKDSTLVQIGFKFPLNYDFVSGNSVAAAQIFHLLPKALVDASSLDAEKVRMAKLVPFDTRNTAGYITTLAKLHYPQNLVDDLKASISAPNSKLYNNPSELVNNLTALINPTIAILGNNDDEGAKTGGSGSNNNDAFGPGSPQSSQSSRQRATTAGIVMGAVGIGAMYGAAMFIVARRYKRKRQNHRRSRSLSSVDRSDEIQYADNGSPAFSDGALLRPKRGTHGGRSQNSISSALSANISAPVATENSLSWN